MALPKFEYHAPKTLEEALGLKERYGAEARVLAGGTDLLVKMRLRRLRPRVLIDIKGIPGLETISYDPRKGLSIGATTLLADVAGHPGVRRRYPAVAYAAAETANVQVRNKGTVAGNLCNAAPSADNAPALLALQAQVVLQSVKEERRLALDEFFLGPGSTAMQPNEILTSIFVPLPPLRAAVSYQHISPRGKVDISAVSVAAMLALEDGKCRQVRIFLGAVAPTPLRATRAEKVLAGQSVTQERLLEAGRRAAAQAKPISDVRASAAYRKEMVAVLTRRALAEAHQMASGKK